jgi:hypothetical protein
MAAHLDPVAWAKKVRIRKIVLITLAAVLLVTGVTLYLLRNRIIPAIRYARAEREESRGEIMDAIETFALLGTYRDANARASKLAYGLDTTLRQRFADAKVGEVVEFGRYEQDNDPADGQEPIRWLVLAEKDGRCLLWSVYILDEQPYHEVAENVVWKDCSLRTWLNGTFLDTAFTQKERALIAKTRLENKSNPAVGTKGGAATEDYVAIISFNELLTYGLNATFLEGLWAEPTEYAVAQGADRHEWYGTAMWWLRTPGQSADQATYCDMVGQPIYTTVVNKGGIGVRPMIWVFLPDAE